jgi:hypothetical protein
MCLGYQGCVFHFSTEFCRGDPVPLFRKQLDMNVVCELDAAFLTTLAPQWAQRMPKQVVHLKYESKLEVPLRQYESTVILPVINQEENVLELECPTIQHAKSLGYGLTFSSTHLCCFKFSRYLGNCTDEPSDREVLSKKLWMKFAKYNSTVMKSTKYTV